MDYSSNAVAEAKAADILERKGDEAGVLKDQHKALIEHMRSSLRLFSGLVVVGPAQTSLLTAVDELRRSGRVPHFFKPGASPARKNVKPPLHSQEEIDHMLGKHAGVNGKPKQK